MWICKFVESKIRQKPPWTTLVFRRAHSRSKRYKRKYFYPELHIYKGTLQETESLKKSLNRFHSCSFSNFVSGLCHMPHTIKNIKHTTVSSKVNIGWKHFKILNTEKWKCITLPRGGEEQKYDTSFLRWSGWAEVLAKVSQFLPLPRGLD